MKTLRVNLFLIFLLSACAPATISAPSVTQPPTNESIITPTKIASSTPEAIYQPPTAISGFQPEEARAEVLDLLINNKDCELPCFWGIKSGQSPWNEANEFLKKLSIQYTDESTLNKNSFFYSNYFLPATDIYGDYDLQLELGVSNGIIYTISVSDFNVPNYYLSEFLLANGQPDEIWVFTNSVNPTGIDKIGFLVSLYYKEKQMIATYGRGQATIGDKWLTGCIMYSPSLKIWAWDESFKAPETALNGLDMIRTNWKSISEATQGTFDTDKFYQSFSNSNVEPCFQMPKNIWSEP